MAITINSTRENDNDQTVYFSIDYDGDKKWHGDIPKDADPQEWFNANEDLIKTQILRQQYRDADVPQLEDKTALESFEAWIANGCKNAEIKETITTPAQPAVDAVMGERQVVVESEVDEEVSKTEIVEVDGKFVEKTTTETVKKTVSTPQVTKHKLYNEAGEEIGEHEVPVMESYTITPAVEAVAEQTETVVTRAESVVEKVAWKDTAE
tara:strand:- start:11893 stop:12519 length:627 start_codon:yes stop_codon:yes gene_type:complete